MGLPVPVTRLSPAFLLVLDSGQSAETQHLISPGSCVNRTYWKQNWKSAEEESADHLLVKRVSSLLTISTCHEKKNLELSHRLNYCGSGECGGPTPAIFILRFTHFITQKSRRSIQVAHAIRDMRHSFVRFQV